MPLLAFVLIALFVCVGVCGTLFAIAALLLIVVAFLFLSSVGLFIVGVAWCGGSGGAGTSGGSIGRV